MAVVLMAAAACSDARVQVESGLAIVGATVIDMTGSPPRPDMTVVVQDGRIVSVAPTDSLVLSDGVQRVDGAGRYLIPGLWDMHTHVAEYAPVWLPVMLANGITGVRNMHAVSLELTNNVKRLVDSGEWTGPRMVANGPLLDGPRSPWPDAVRVDTAEAAAAAVDDLASQGADFIKVYSFLSREAFFAAAAEAQRIGIPFAGHVPQSVSAREAASAGQHSIEHLDGVLMAAAAGEEGLRQRFAAASTAWNDPGTAVEGQAAMAAVYRDLAAQYDEQKAAALFAAFITNDTYQTPTLVTHYTNIHRAESDILENPTLRYVPASVRAQWLSLPPPNPEMRASQEQQYARYREVVRTMQAAGVSILAGTDTGGALIVPGDSLHRELALLIEAGLTPLQALEAATRNAATYFGEAESSGTVEPGKRADLVLLDDNPLENIANTRTIVAVVREGTLYDRADLDAMLAAAAAEAAMQ